MRELPFVLAVKVPKRDEETYTTGTYPVYHRYIYFSLCFVYFVENRGGGYPQYIVRTDSALHSMRNTDLREQKQK